MQIPKGTACGALPAAFVLAACGSGVRGGPGVAVNMLTGGAPSAALYENLRSLGAHVGVLRALDEPLAVTGESSTAQLKSLKYRIVSIDLCKSLTTNGTAYTNSSGCWSVYTSGLSQSQSDYQDFTVDKALLTDDGYLDLTDQAKLKAALNKKVTAKVGEYNYGVINWYRPIKAKAEVTLSDGTTLVTKRAVNGVVADLRGTAGTAEEIAVDLQNGGGWFKFQKPFVITQADMDADSAYTLDLVLNLDRLIKASSSGVSNSPVADSSQRGFFVPLISLSPVAHKAADKAVRETYVLSSPLTPQFDIRVELYTISSDTTKTIYGADNKVLYKGAATTTNVMHPYQPFAVTETAEGVEFQDWQKASYLKKLKRLKAVGDTGTATFVCPSHYTGACTSGESIEMSTVLTALGDVE